VTRPFAWPIEALAGLPGLQQRDATDAPVGLVVPERQPGFFAQVFRQVHVTAAQAAGIQFLQTDDVVLLHQVADAIEVAEALCMRQHVFPAVRDVVAVAGGADSGLNVITQQPQALPG